MRTHKPAPKLVALIMDTAKAFDRNVIRGVASFVAQQAHWSLYVEENPLDKLPDLLSNKKKNGNTGCIIVTPVEYLLAFNSQMVIMG